MRREELEALVADGPDVDRGTLRMKGPRPAVQLEVNSLWEGGCSPHRPEGSRDTVRTGIFVGGDRAPAAAKAERRLKLDVGYPKVILVASEDGQQIRVLGYSDSVAAARVARALGVVPKAVPKPVMASNPSTRSRVDISHLKRSLSQCPNIILQGPPGTGKTTLAAAYIASLVQPGSDPSEMRFGRLLADADGKFENLLHPTSKAASAPVVWEFVQAHPSYSYDDLVRGLVPATRNGKPCFEVRDRVLTMMCRLAEARAGKPTILVIDEINRCDLGAVLGEFIFAIDPGHRGIPVRLQYQSQDGDVPAAIAAPANLAIIGTMNTADRSIAMVDYAVRRRFRFLDLPASRDAIGLHYATDPARGDLASSLFDAVNANISSRLKIGHAAFLVDLLPSETWSGRLARRVAFHVVPTMLEYFHEGAIGSDTLFWDGDELSLRRPRELAITIQARLDAALGADAAVGA
jgi:5-methylcytosine-specific restriction protein B